MQEDVSALARKYREEMLRLYGGRQAVPAVSTPPAAIVETSPPPPEPEAFPEPEAPALVPDDALPAFPEETAPAPPDTAYEEPVLPDYIRNGPELPELLNEEEASGYTAEGQLQVIAAAGNNAFPVPGAAVTVYRRHDGREHLMYSLLTDENGATPLITLPTAPAALSQEPGNAQPFAEYDVRILAPGYFRVLAEDVPVFAGITSRQTFQLIPLAMTVHEDVETIVYPGSHPAL